MRRLHVPLLSADSVTLDAVQSHHVRTVLRLVNGDAVEIFDDAGRTGIGAINQLQPAVTIRMDSIVEASAGTLLTVASAVPKGDRADWLVEKLSEMGVDRWVPLRTARSVVHPEGEKTKRWERIAIEAAKQSRRTGVMSIDRLTPLAMLLMQCEPATTFVLSTQPGTLLLNTAIRKQRPSTVLIGPEGGWDDAEASDMISRGLTAVSLGPTILRIETAALVAAAVVRLLG